MEFQPRSFNLQEMLSGLVELMSGRAWKKGLQLEYYIDDRIPLWLTGDVVKIRQVLLNLIGNAIKFTEEGAINVVVSAISNKQHCYRFEVIDTGEGIPLDLQKTIFEAFCQANHNLRQPGTGLGLAISQRMIDCMQGTLHVDSRPGRGSCFSFELELPAGDIVQQAITESAELPCYRVLLVEDNPVNSLVAKGYLEQLGQYVVCADSGEKARTAMQQGRFDLVLMDISLPDTDGVTLTSELREMVDYQFPVIAVSAHVFREDQDNFIRQGMDACLGKPLRLNILERTLLEVMSGQESSFYTEPEDEVLGECEDSSPPLNTAQLMEDIDILGADEVSRLAEMFKTSSLSTLLALQAATDPEETGSLAHSLKGAASSMGLEKLSVYVAEIERNAARGNILKHEDKEELALLYQQSLKALASEIAAAR